MTPYDHNRHVLIWARRQLYFFALFTDFKLLRFLSRSLSPWRPRLHPRSRETPCLLGSASPPLHHPASGGTISERKFWRQWGQVSCRQRVPTRLRAESQQSQHYYHGHVALPTGKCVCFTSLNSWREIWCFTPDVDLSFMSSLLTSPRFLPDEETERGWTVMLPHWRWPHHLLMTSQQGGGGCFLCNRHQETTRTTSCWKKLYLFMQ